MVPIRLSIDRTGNQSEHCAEGDNMENVLALQNVESSTDPLDDELCWSTCSSSNCSSTSVFVPVTVPDC
jgi:hypothetical protein